MKRFLPIILAAALAITGCGSAAETKVATVSETETEVADQAAACEVKYEGTVYVLNAEGILIEKRNTSVLETVSADKQTDQDYLDEQEAIRESMLENQDEVEVDEEVEDDAEFDAVASFGDKKIINYEDDIYIANESGEKLTEEYMDIKSNFSGIDNTKEPEYFLCVKENTIDIFNSDIELVRSIEVQDINTVEGYGDYMIYNVNSGNANTTSGMMDLEGNITMAPSRYYSIEPLSKYANGQSCSDNVFICKYKDLHDAETIDIVNEKADILVDSLLAFSFINNDKFGTLRGNTVGFMDYSGEWITKNAI